MSIDHLRYDQVAFKASHNSIDRRQTITAQLTGGDGLVEPCHGLELDLVQAPDKFDWTVKHGARDSGPPLKKVLEEIETWSSQNPQHTVLTVHLDLKNAPLGHVAFASAIEKLLLDVFGGERIYAPQSVIGGHEDLVRGARAGSWATLGELRGKIILCLSGNGRRKSSYARHDPPSRLCFADYAGSKGPRKTGHRVFANLFVDARRYSDSLRSLSRRAGFVTRAYSIASTWAWDRCIDGGTNILSTDDLDNRAISFRDSGHGCAKLAVARGVSS